MNLQTTPAKPAGSRERSLDEVKAEFMRRAGRLNPFEDIRREDAERVMNALQNLDKDHWAEEWSKIGLGYEEKATPAPRPARPAPSLPSFTCTPSTPAASAAIRRRIRRANLRRTSIRCACSARRRNISIPPLEIIELPFDGNKKLIGYLQLPPGVNKPPVVLHWGGVDGWKEDRLRIAKAIMEQGLASLTIDMPGSGENPVLYGDPVGRAHVSSPGSIICRSAARSTAAASASGAAVSAPIGRRGSPTPPPTASRARCSTAAMSITAFRRNG